MSWAGMLLILVLSGCATTQQRLLDSDVSQVQLRSYQSRAFDMTDREKMLRTILATLQDLDFVIDEADAVLGSVSATKLNQYALRMSVTVRPRGTTQLLVRANCQFGLKPVHQPEPYQQFFAALAKGIFLEAHMVEEATEGGGDPAGPAAPSGSSGVAPEPVTPSGQPASGKPSGRLESRPQPNQAQSPAPKAQEADRTTEEERIYARSAEDQSAGVPGARPGALPRVR